jgi:hypothetical protein
LHVLVEGVNERGIVLSKSNMSLVAAHVAFDKGSSNTQVQSLELTFPEKRDVGAKAAFKDLDGAVVAVRNDDPANLIIVDDFD